MYFRAILLVLAGMMLVGATCHRPSNKHVEYAGETGSLSGVLTDSASGVPALGVSVILKGTKIGTISDPEGKYEIKRIPPGTWTVVMTSVEYKKLEIKKVVITANQATKLDVLLVENKKRDLNRTIRL
jgi:hypothetical protein